MAERVHTSDRPAHARAGSERGVALLITLLVLALLTIMVIDFTYASQVGYRRAALWLKARQAALLAESGVLLAEELLAQDARFSQTDSLKDLWAKPFPPIDTDYGKIHVSITDENRRFNLNTLAKGTQSPEGRRFQALLATLELDPLLAGTLGDWVDRNQSVNAAPEGAEQIYYADLDPPYTPRDGPLLSFGELGLVRGFTPEAIATLRPFACVLDATADKVNVNTAPPEVLRALDPALQDGSLVTALLQHRDVEPLANAAELRAVEGWDRVFRGDKKVDKLFAFSSSDFRVLATGEVDGVFQSVEAVLHRDFSNIRVLYWLARRGPNIAGIDQSQPVELSEPALLATR